LAGSGGVPPLPFFLANVLGALVYVPLTVAEGYAVGYGVGNTVTRIHRDLVTLQHLLLLGILLELLLLLGWRIWRRRQAEAGGCPDAEPL
jgi:membrane protein DedA with SNARE-associated domain